MSSAISLGDCDACASSSSSTISMYSGIALPAWLVLGLVRRAFARRDELVQAVVDVEAPGAGAAIVALERRHQTHVREAQLGLISALLDLEHDVGAVPFGLVLD